MNPRTSVSNPGPPWAFGTIAFLEKYLPGFLFRGLLKSGTFIGWLLMPEQRGHSREYLRQVTGKNPSLRLQVRHFQAFMESLVLKLRAGRRKLPDLTFAEDAHREAFVSLCQSSGPVLFGTFHVGFSDLMGCMLSEFDRCVSMVRLRVGNSLDTELLEKTFGTHVNFLWINDPADFIFSLKEEIQRGSSIALQCDRIEFGSKLGGFHFLGARRVFPITIYHLSELFHLPVVFAFTGPFRRGKPIEVYTSSVYIPGEDRADNRKRAREHFQKVLNRLECHLQNHPELWFNFLPLNREADNELD